MASRARKANRNIVGIAGVEFGPDVGPEERTHAGGVRNMFSTSGYGGFGDLLSDAAAEHAQCKAKDPSLQAVRFMDTKTGFVCLPKAERIAWYAKCDKEKKLAGYNSKTKQWGCYESEYATKVYSAKDACLAQGKDYVLKEPENKFYCVDKEGTLSDVESGNWFSQQSAGAKAGIVVGALAVVGVIGYFAYDVLKTPEPAKSKPNRRRRRRGKRS